MPSIVTIHTPASMARPASKVPRGPGNTAAVSDARARPGPAGGPAAPARSGFDRLVNWLSGLRRQVSRDPGPPAGVPLRERHARQAAPMPRLASCLVEHSLKPADRLVGELRKSIQLGQARQSSEAELSRSLRAQLQPALATLDAGQLAKIFLGLTAALGDLAPSDSADARLVSQVQTGAIRELSRRGAPDRIRSVLGTLPSEKIIALSMAVNGARMAVLSLGPGRLPGGTAALLERLESAVSARTRVDLLLRDTLAEQQAMRLDDGSKTRTARLSGARGETVSVPLLPELEKDLGRARHTIASRGGEPVALMVDVTDEDSIARSKQDHLQRIFAEIADCDVPLMQQISRYCQQGVWAGLEQAMATRNSPFKLADGTPVCFPQRTQELAYHLERQANGDVSIEARIEYRPQTIASYVQSQRPDLAIAAAVGSSCGASFTVRIPKDGGPVSIAKPLATWAIFAAAHPKLAD